MVFYYFLDDSVDYRIKELVNPSSYQCSTHMSTANEHLARVMRAAALSPETPNKENATQCSQK